MQVFRSGAPLGALVRALLVVFVVSFSTACTTMYPMESVKESQKLAASVRPGDHIHVVMMSGFAHRVAVTSNDGKVIRGIDRRGNAFGLQIDLIANMKKVEPEPGAVPRPAEDLASVQPGARVKIIMMPWVTPSIITVTSNDGKIIKGNDRAGNSLEFEVARIAMVQRLKPGTGMKDRGQIGEAVLQSVARVAVEIIARALVEGLVRGLAKL